MKSFRLSLLLFIGIVALFSCKKTEVTPSVRSNLLGNWVVTSNFNYSKDGVQISAWSRSFFLNLKNDGTGTRAFLNGTDTIYWAYTDAPESVLVIVPNNYGYTYSGDKYIVNKNEADAQIWETNTKKTFFLDTGFVLVNYMETWNMTRK